MKIFNESNLELNQQRYSSVDLFSTEGRIGRQSYFVYSFILPMALLLVLTSIAGFISKMGSAATVVSYALLALSVAAVLLLVVHLTIQRCHDFNANGGLAVFAIIPFINFVFALIPADNGLNSYGEAPEPAPLYIQVLAFLLGIFLISVISYIAIQFFSINIDELISL